MNFRVGQKVVCVDDSPIIPGMPVPFHRGEIVTVSGFTHTGCISLAEYPANPVSGYMPERFRPVVERPTDISIFTKMLTPNRKVRADLVS